MTVSACIPCFNGAGTLSRAIESIRLQTKPVEEILVIDDGSTDSSVAVAERAGARVIRHRMNCGRGAARATAVNESRGECVLFCDAGTALDSVLLEHALPHLSAPGAAAVFGWVQSEPRSAAERWRARHLFKSDAPKQFQNKALLATAGSVLRRDAVLQAGNFNADLREDEDADLGRRLLAAGWDVIFSPDLRVTALARDNVGSVLRRYARWNNASASPSWSSYPQLVSYSLRSMVAQDLRAGDWPSAMLSLLCPHYQFWCFLRSAKERKHAGQPA